MIHNSSSILIDDLVRFFDLLFKEYSLENQKNEMLARFYSLLVNQIKETIQKTESLLEDQINILAYLQHIKVIYENSKTSIAQFPTSIFKIFAVRVSFISIYSYGDYLVIQVWLKLDFLATIHW